MQTALIAEDEEEVSFFEESEDQDTDFPIDTKSQLEEISKVVVMRTDWSTATIFDQIVRQNVQLNPRFQKRDAWNITRKSRFIESLILGFPVPQIVLAETKIGKNFIVLDGKQRLLTILQFYGNSQSPNNKFHLQNLEFRTDLNGYGYEDLQSNISLMMEQNALDNQTIRTILIRNWKSENFLYKVFLRLNLQSSPLSTQEFRQALHPGDFINFLDKQSIKSQALKKIFKSKNPDFRMRDVELLLRYVGFHYFLSEYRGNLKTFLDMTCERLNKDWKLVHNDVENLVDEFEQAVQTIITIFGDNFSRMWLKNNQYQSRFNRAILDVMVFYFSDEIIRKSAEEHKQKVEEAFKQLCISTNSQFKESIEVTPTNIRETYNRLRLWGESLLEVLDIEFNIPELVDNRIIFNGFR